jgi:hypothetical protein
MCNMIVFTLVAVNFKLLQKYKCQVREYRISQICIGEAFSVPRN